MGEWHITTRRLSYWMFMQLHLSPSMKSITILASSGGGNNSCNNGSFIDFMKIKIAAARSRTLFHTILVVAFLLPFVFILTTVVTLEGVNNCHSFGEDVDVNENENANLDAGYLHTNGNADPENANANANGEQLHIAAAALIRSHSVSGDLHGVQPDPVAADILRKEPEQETFVRLRITPYETPSPDEAEVFKALQVCLEMRAVMSSGKALLHGRKRSYLTLVLQSATQILLIISVREKPIIIFPVADATTFFTDLHHILKLIAAGNTRTVCHHRLDLLEQVKARCKSEWALFQDRLANADKAYLKQNRT